MRWGIFPAALHSTVDFLQKLCYNVIGKSAVLEDMSMHQIGHDELMFFDKAPTAFPLYEVFTKKLFDVFPSTSMRVQKSQITFSSRYVYACVSLTRVKKKVELPDPYIVITLGLSYPLNSNRVAVKTEPCPGRWTTHIVVGSVSELDDELFIWVKQAYDFAENK